MQLTALLTWLLTLLLNLMAVKTVCQLNACKMGDKERVKLYM